MHAHRTVTDVGAEGNPLGVAVAGLSVVSSGMQQIFCRTMQQQHRLSANELLSNTAPVQVSSPACRWSASLSRSHGCCPILHMLASVAALACCCPLLKEPTSRHQAEGGEFVSSQLLCLAVHMINCRLQSLGPAPGSKCKRGGSSMHGLHDKPQLP